MRVVYTDLDKERQQQALALCLEAQGELLDLGKKISVPQDVMIEELKLKSNRGSRMFMERQKRVEKFTLESTGERSECPIHQEEAKVQQVDIKPPEKDKTGNPNILAPGYSGPLREVPHEKFNVTIVPKSYSSPWGKNNCDALIANLPEPPQKLTPASYKCFNRAPMPFEGTAGSVKTLPLPGFERLQAFTEPNLTWERMCDRPNFNRAPAGWKAQNAAETADL
ncbi:myozenin-2 [Hoplias malabaricus]|uniref:myozenin-2 n=1 Tax=Hoplias malabaricus TaxID=27720 RepID=UPI003462B6E3